MLVDESAVKDLWRNVELGIDTKAFLQSEIGQNLIANIHANWMQARNDLEVAVSLEEVGELQDEIRRCRTFVDWLNTLISQGERSEELLKEIE